MDRGDGGGEKEDRGLVKKASSAYMFYSRAVSATVRQELESENVGEPVAIGDVGRRVSELWKGLAPDERHRLRERGPRMARFDSFIAAELREAAAAPPVKRDAAAAAAAAEGFDRLCVAAIEDLTSAGWAERASP